MQKAPMEMDISKPSNQDNPASQGTARMRSPQPEQTLNLEIHGLKTSLSLNRPQEDIIPRSFLKKADRTTPVTRPPWIFRGTTDARQINPKKWSKIDIRFRGVFRTLKKVPPFKHGLYEGDEQARMWNCAFRLRFGLAARAQGQVLYALLEDVLGALKITREMGDQMEIFYLRPRLVNCQMEYWTGYRVKYKDAPYTAGVLSLEFKPETPCAKALLPLSTTSEPKQPLRSVMEGEVKLLLGQLLLHIHRLHPPGDQIPDQEVFLIGLHGSRLHVLRGIFPGSKTSRLWCGRHNPSEGDSATMMKLMATPAGERFYTKQNIERFIQQVEWHKLASDDQRSPRAFRVLGSCEYDLWVKGEFRDAMRLLVGLMLYLMSGKARCGILQHVFEEHPYDENVEPDSGDEVDIEQMKKDEKIVVEQEMKLKEMEKLKREEEQERFCAREAMRSSASDHIGGFRDFRQPWWDWVWEDKTDDGRDKDMTDLGNGP